MHFVTSSSDPVRCSLRKSSNIYVTLSRVMSKIMVHVAVLLRPPEIADTCITLTWPPSLRFIALYRIIIHVIILFIGINAHIRYAFIVRLVSLKCEQSSYYHPISSMTSSIAIGNEIIDRMRISYYAEERSLKEIVIFYNRFIKE